MAQPGHAEAGTDADADTDTDTDEDGVWAEDGLSHERTQRGSFAAHSSHRRWQWRSTHSRKSASEQCRPSFERNPCVWISI